MAASMRNTITLLSYRIGSLSTVKAPLSLTSRRSASSNHPESDNVTPKVAVSQDGNTILCWHPEPEFPYEHTKPIQRKMEELTQGESVLKVQYLMSEKMKYREDGPNDKELANIFFTSKHRWYPKPQKKYIKVRKPKDRDRL